MKTAPSPAPSPTPPPRPSASTCGRRCATSSHCSGGCGSCDPTTGVCTSKAARNCSAPIPGGQPHLNLSFGLDIVFVIDGADSTKQSVAAAMEIAAQFTMGDSDAGLARFGMITYTNRVNVLTPLTDSNETWSSTPCLPFSDPCVPACQPAYTQCDTATAAALTQAATMLNGTANGGRFYSGARFRDDTPYESVQAVIVIGANLQVSGSIPYNNPLRCAGPVCSSRELWAQGVHVFAVQLENNTCTYPTDPAPGTVPGYECSAAPLMATDNTSFFTLAASTSDEVVAATQPASSTSSPVPATVIAASVLSTIAASRKHRTCDWQEYDRCVVHFFCVFFSSFVCSSILLFASILQPRDRAGLQDAHEAFVGGVRCSVLQRASLQGGHNQQCGARLSRYWRSGVPLSQRVSDVLLAASSEDETGAAQGGRRRMRAALSDGSPLPAHRLPQLQRVRKSTLGEHFFPIALTPVFFCALFAYTSSFYRTPLWDHRLFQKCEAGFKCGCVCSSNSDCDQSALNIGCSQCQAIDPVTSFGRCRSPTCGQSCTRDADCADAPSCTKCTPLPNDTRGEFTCSAPSPDPIPGNCVAPFPGEPHKNCSATLDLMLLLDGSGSIQSAAWNDIMRCVVSTLQSSFFAVFRCSSLLLSFLCCCCCFLSCSSISSPLVAHYFFFLHRQLHGRNRSQLHNG